jgi:D-arabinose 1-dehydrogenase-like Zn-dependent alcohol dehydrogenase
MKPFGHIILLSLAAENLHLPYLPLLMKEISIHTSLVGRPEEFDDMLAFAAEHDVRPIVEQFPMTEEGVAQAIEKLSSGSIRYRAVLAV